VGRLRLRCVPRPWPAEADRLAAGYAFETSAAELGFDELRRVAYRRLPILHVSETTIFVGSVHIGWVAGSVEVLVEEIEHWSWSAAECDLRSVAESLDLAPVDWRTRSGKPLWAVESTRLARLDPHSHVAAVAGALAENTRNQVALLRRRRSLLAADLSGILRGEGDPSGTTVRLASLVELARAASRVREECLDAARGGMDCWRQGTDSEGDEGYHQYRKVRTPELLRETASPDHKKHAWLRMHDLAIRHLEGAADELGDLATQIYGLLGGISSTAALREAQAQERLNVVVACAAVGFGLPGLVFALYGADLLTPFDGLRQSLTLAAVLLLTCLAVVGVYRALRPPDRARRVGAADASARNLVLILGAVAVAVIIFVAGKFGPQPPGSGYSCAPKRGEAATLICTAR
jgi:hypothetical protein